MTVAPVADRSSGEDSASQVDLLVALEGRRIAATLAADVDELDALIDDRCRYVHSSGSVDTKTSYLAQLHTGRLRYIDIAVTEITPSVHDSCGVVCFRLDATVGVAEQQRTMRARCVWISAT